jgi:hypothetical protein
MNSTLCAENAQPDCLIIARNVVKNDQISGQFYIPGNGDNLVKILPGLQHSGYFFNFDWIGAPHSGQAYSIW